MKKGLVERLSVVDDGKESLREVGQRVVRKRRTTVLVLQVDGGEDLLLNASVFILDWYNFESLICAEGDQQQVKDELPRKQTKTDVLLEGAKRDAL